MWPKKDRLAGGKLKDNGQRGEWAELYFMMQAAGRGMKVLRLVGTGPYDVGLENQGRLLRVQVKSTTNPRPNGGYILNVMMWEGKYTGAVDFFAILVIPLDDWYIIPYEAIRGGCVVLTRDSNRGKYAQYREAWHLLRETGLTIQACADPEWPEVEAKLGEDPQVGGSAQLTADSSPGFQPGSE